MVVTWNYDIRGKYPFDIDEKFAYNLGKAIVVFLDAKEIAIGHDARVSSPKLYESIIKGMRSQGASIVRVGLATSPLMYFLSWNKNFDGTICVTASHNPKEYNGFKISGKKGKYLGRDTGLNEIKKLLEKNECKEKNKGKVVDEDFSDYYVDFLSKFVDEDFSNIKIVVDVSNGSVGRLVEKLSSKLNFKLKKLNFSPDGNFPGHSPNPLESNSQKDVINELKKGKYSLGIIFDGDADRIVFFDEKGDRLKSSTIAQIVCKYYYEDVSKKAIVLDILNYRSSVRKNLEPLGISIFPSRVGFSNMKNSLAKIKGLFGAEYSGHFNHSEVGNCDNGLFMLIKLVSCMIKERKALSELAQEFEKEIVLLENFRVEDKDEKIKLFDETFNDAGETLHIDGVSKFYSDHWINVRKSNTEQLLRVTIESSTKQQAEQLLKKIQISLGLTDGERYS